LREASIRNRDDSGLVGPHIDGTNLDPGVGTAEQRFQQSLVSSRDPDAKPDVAVAARNLKHHDRLAFAQPSHAWSTQPMKGCEKVFGQPYDRGRGDGEGLALEASHGAPYPKPGDAARER
jgi:hypothetical protein